MMRIEGLAEGTALSIALEAGAVSRCRTCEEVLDEGTWADVPELTDQLYRNKDTRVAGIDREDLNDALKYARENLAGIECRCQRED